MERCERHCGAFERDLTFPEAVDPQQARAEYGHGTCRIFLPKRRVGKAAELSLLAVEGERCALRLAVP
jgi:HSP20 family molecular chaperone IbpA